MNCAHIGNKKVKLLFNDYDSDGYWIWQCILAYSYSTKGYYFDLKDSDELLLFATDYCKKDVKLVTDVIEAAIKRGLFDDALADQYKILSSDHMQETYLYATSERRRKGTQIEMIKEFLLINISVDTRNLTIVPYNNSIVPESIPVVPRNNNNNTIAPTEEENKLAQLKKAYHDLKKDKASIYHFINNNRPQFHDPYADMWNIWAGEYGKQKIEVMTEKRRTHFNARIREKEFNFLDILAKATKSNVCLMKKWFCFDFIIKNKDNYIKLMEGNYDNEPAPEVPEHVNKQAEELLKLKEAKK